MDPLTKIPKEASVWSSNTYVIDFEMHVYLIYIHYEPVVLGFIYFYQFLSIVLVMWLKNFASNLVGVWWNGHDILSCAVSPWLYLDNEEEF